MESESSLSLSAENVRRGWKGLASISSMATSACPAAAGVFSTVWSSALRPRPNAFLVMLDDLLGQIQIAGGALAFRVVEKNGFAETGRLRQAHIARDHGGENLVAEEIPQIVTHLARKV